LISEVRVITLEHPRDAVALVAAIVNAAVRVVEHGVFGKDVVDRPTPTQRIDLTEHVFELAKQQGVLVR